MTRKMHDERCHQPGLLAAWAIAPDEHVDLVGGDLVRESLSNCCGADVLRDVADVLVNVALTHDHGLYPKSRRGRW